nr:hypothetical protein [Streptomyces pluripotens]
MAAMSTAEATHSALRTPSRRLSATVTTAMATARRPNTAVPARYGPSWPPRGTTYISNMPSAITVCPVCHQRRWPAIDQACHRCSTTTPP